MKVVGKFSIPFTHYQGIFQNIQKNQPCAILLWSHFVNILFPKCETTWRSSKRPLRFEYTVYCAIERKTPLGMKRVQPSNFVINYILKIYKIYNRSSYSAGWNFWTADRKSLKVLFFSTYQTTCTVLVIIILGSWQNVIKSTIINSTGNIIIHIILFHLPQEKVESYLTPGNCKIQQDTYMYIALGSQRGWEVMFFIFKQMSEEFGFLNLVISVRWVPQYVFLKTIEKYVYM